MTAAVEHTGAAEVPVTSLEEEARVVAAIKQTADCSYEQASQTLDMVAALLASARQNKGVARLTAEQLNSTAYQVLDSVMPHGQTGHGDSAHALIEDYLLDADRREIGLIHDEVEDCDINSPSYCALLVSMIVR